MANKLKDKSRKLHPKEITPADKEAKNYQSVKKGMVYGGADPYNPESENIRLREPVTKVLQNAGFTREMIEVKVADLLLRNVKETQALKNEPETSNFDLIIISVIEAAQRGADTGRLDNLLEKIFGKTVHISGNVNVTKDENVGEADAELIQRALERALKNSS